ncbi:MAG TPA: hypothetical protein VNC78_05135 [Actinomycetota bacterium]|nr:hypothetical protein [Actinomycetota bacterium]
MRRLGVLLVIAGLLFPTTATAEHAPESSCSPSGDVCTSAEKIDVVQYLRIGLTAKHFDQYRLCVRAPDDTRQCKTFQIQEMGEQFGDKVRWRRHFPNKGPGAYKACWRWEGSTRCRTNGFHI